jgi:serine/threonine protein kinase
MGVGHSFKTDIWSLGVLMCEIITSHNPFFDQDASKMYERIKTANFKKLEGIDY